MQAGAMRKGALPAQWALYLAGSALLGLAWALPVYGFLKLVDGSLGGVPTVLVPACLVVASLFGGLLYRWAAAWKGRLPSLWFAVLMPGIGVVSLFAMAKWWMEGRPSVTDAGFGMMMGALMTTYVCGGIVLVPLSVPHVLGYRWLHRRLDAWAPKAEIRSIRHVGYGFASACLLFFTEGSRVLDQRATEQVVEVAQPFEVVLPPKAELLGASGNHYDFTAVAHFRTKAKFSWPSNARAMSHPEPDSVVIRRFQGLLRGERSRLRDVSQAKWSGPYGDEVFATRLRTDQADYLELRKSYPNYGTVIPKPRSGD